MARALNNPLAVSLGDPAGIGPEVIAKCWDHRDSFNLPPFVAIGDPRSVAAVWDGPIEVIDDPRQADSAFDYGLPLIQLNAPRSDVPGHPSVAGAHTSLEFAGNCGWPRPLRLRFGGSHGSGRQGAAVRNRLPASGPDRVRCRTVRRITRQCRDDAGWTHAKDRAGHNPPTAEGSGVAAEQRPHRIARPCGAARTSAQFRDRRASACRIRAQSAFRRRWTAGPRGDGNHRARDRRPRCRGMAGHRPPPCRHDVPHPRPGKLRCGAVHVSRPGTDPDQGAAFRGCASTSRLGFRSSEPRPTMAPPSILPARTAPIPARWRRPSAWLPRTRSSAPNAA